MSNLEMYITSSEKKYPILISREELSSIKNLVLKEVNGKNYVIVISKKVHSLYSKILNFPKDNIYVLNDGEKEKNQINYLKILNFVQSKNLKREDYIIGIGGGVVGDIAGFVAATYMRGINFIQIPTTLLAMTDSSVGGKVAINTKYGKNLVGAFYQPKVVFINVNFLDSLDVKQFKSGLGEVLKYGFIEKSCNCNFDIGLISFLEENFAHILHKNKLVLEQLITNCVNLKISVVQADEKEGGLRKILNYGHTYGHAVENITNYKKYTHGECVVEGIKFALNLAHKRNLIEKEYFHLCFDVINKFDYSPLRFSKPSKLVSIMAKDKKATNNFIKLILPISYATVGEYDFTIDELERELS